MTSSRSRTRPAFTLVELLIVILIIALLLAIVIPVLAGARERARKLKDSTHVRGVVQALTVWAGNHGDTYPLPSRLDLADHTVNSGGLPPFAKDNLANIVSILIYNDLLAIEQCISPVEVNANVEQDFLYDRELPSKALRPENALWDPGFSAALGPPPRSEENSYTGVGLGRRDPTVGNMSYAMMPPHGARRERWGSKFESRTVVAGTRGTRYIGEPGDWQPVPLPQGAVSNSFKFFSPKNAWQGHAAFADGRVDFLARADPEDLPVVFESATGSIQRGRAYGDNIFVNENDLTGAQGSDNVPHDNKNAYITIFVDVRQAIVDGVARPTIIPLRD